MLPTEHLDLNFPRRSEVRLPADTEHVAEKVKRHSHVTPRVYLKALPGLAYKRARAEDAR
jgi:hypothetical protein